MPQPLTDAKDTEVEWFYEDPQDILDLIKKKKKDIFFIRGLECKNRKSRDTWSNR